MMKNFRIFRKNSLNGFTLIEMMMVLVIIGILAGLITAGAFKAIEDAKKSQAESSIATLEGAIAMYESDVGSYPAGGGAGNNFKTWLQNDDASTGWNGPYMNFTADELSGNAYEDPWGNGYNYQTGVGINNEGFVDIWSNGPDGLSGSGDDITNW